MPADSDLPALPHTFRPWGVRLASVGLGIALVVIVTAIWFAFPQDIRDQFTPFQKLTVLGIGVMLFRKGHAMSRCRVVADEDGITVVNGYRSHRYRWEQVVDVNLHPGDPWAVLDLSDGTSRSAMGIQGSDGRSARRQALQLKALVSARSSAPED